MARLTRDNRLKAVGMHIGGMTAARIAQHLNVHRSTISRLITKHRLTDDVTDRPRPGRPRVTNAVQDRYIRIAHLRYDFFFSIFFNFL